MKYIIPLCLILICSCSKMSVSPSPSWAKHKTDTSLNLTLTYIGDTGIGTMDEVFIFTRVGTDTLKGINNRNPGTVYNWSLPISESVQSWSLMRLINNRWVPISSGSIAP